MTCHVWIANEPLEECGDVTFRFGSWLCLTCMFRGAGRSSTHFSSLSVHVAACATALQLLPIAELDYDSEKPVPDVNWLALSVGLVRRVLIDPEGLRTCFFMAESEEAQEVPSRKKYPRAQQDGEAGTAHSAEADSAAYEPRNGGLHSLCGAEWPGTLTGTRGSDSAGVALQGEPDQTQPTSSRNAVHDRSARHERLDVHLQRSEAAELSRCGTPEEGGHASLQCPAS